MYEKLVRSLAFFFRGEHDVPRRRMAVVLPVAAIVGVLVAAAIGTPKPAFAGFPCGFTYAECGPPPDREWCTWVCANNTYPWDPEDVCNIGSCHPTYEVCQCFYSGDE